MTTQRKSDRNKLKPACAGDYDTHDLCAVRPFVHPTEKDGNGGPLLIHGLPPQTKTEPAWCRTCGALWVERPTFLGFGGGWGFLHHAKDETAQTIANMIRETDAAKVAQRYLAITYGKLALRSVAPLSDRTEAEIAFLQQTLWEKLGPNSRRFVEINIEAAKLRWEEETRE